jgi:hypothetical protein
MRPGNGNGKTARCRISTQGITVPSRAEDKNCFFLQPVLLLFHSFFL